MALNFDGTGDTFAITRTIIASRRQGRGYPMNAGVDSRVTFLHHGRRA
jgi:hypothetical protein